jgi:hypothetical protein
VPIHLPRAAAGGTAGAGGKSFRSPAAPALPGALGLARALRPLRRRVPSRSRFLFDETATAARVADEGLWVPVLRPAPDRWLSVALVVDESASMGTWRQAAGELRQLFEWLGAFRQVRVWGLDADRSPPALYAGLRRQAGPRLARDPLELVDPGGRSLVVIFSDCVAAAWYDGGAAWLVDAWARRGPTVLLQVLPEHLWQRSGLGAAAPVWLRAPGAAVPNVLLSSRPVDDWPGVAEPATPPLPVTPLEPHALAAWARLVAGLGEAGMPGFVLETNPPGAPDLAPETLTADARLGRFLEAASPLARRLAQLLAAAPAVSLPVFRLLREALLPQARQVHEAEVLLGGLLYVEEDAPDPDAVRYQFHDGVRDRLLDALPAADALGVLERVSAYVEDHLGQLRDFPALLADPAAAPGALVPYQSPFARIAGNVLLRLGGDYARLVGRPARATRGPVSFYCSEPSITQMDGVWHVYQKGKAVRVPFRLQAHVSVYVERLAVRTTKESSPDITVAGFEQPVRIDAGQSHDFMLCIDNHAWGHRAPQAFHFYWVLAGTGQPIPFEGQVALFEGRRIEFSPLNVPEQVQLGDVVPASFTLTTGDSPDPDEPLIRIRDCGVYLRPDEGDWLRLVAPTREDLSPKPLEVQPRNAPGVPVRLELRLDTTRLDRERFDQTALEATIVLFDSRGRKWLYEVRVVANRPPPLPHFVAIDWGTTDSFAAYRGYVSPGHKPEPVRFHRRQAPPEVFPSAMYFEDLSDPENPIFHIGPDAFERAQVHPECCLRSVKRKFQFLEHVFVMDEYGRRHVYRTAQVVRFLLHRLISQAEVAKEQEIHHVGFTFPTKWSPWTRKRLAEVLKDLRHQLEAERKPYRIDVLEPAMDEANAVAFNQLVPSGEEGDDQPELPDRFHLVAFDFGGGAVNTCLLEVEYDPARREQHSRFVGIGGRADFGGDDVTRAVMLLLHERLTAALKRREIVLPLVGDKKLRLAEIPLVADGEPLGGSDAGAPYRHTLGRANWDALWQVSERIKCDVCDAYRAGAPPAPGGPMHRTAVANPFQKHLRDSLTQIQCYLEGLEMPRGLDHVLDGIKPDADQERLYEEVRFTLDQACDHPLDDRTQSNHGRPYTVRERIEDTVKELRWQCDNAARAGQPVEPERIVLAGGGCRLPLIAEAMRRHFPRRSEKDPDRIVFQPQLAKQQVAHGMASYLAIRRAASLLVRNLSLSIDVLHHHLGLREVERVKDQLHHVFRPVVCVGAPIDDPGTWHRFVFGAAQVTEGGSAGPGSRTGVSRAARLVLFVQDWRQGAVELGYFDLTRPAVPLPADPPAVQESLPRIADAPYAGELRLRGPSQIDLCVTVAEKRYGPYALLLTAPDPELLLQG